VVWSVQLEPFQRSARVNEMRTGLVLYVPTAVQAVAELQETPDKTLRIAPAGLGVGWTVQSLPSHASASVRVVPALST
jgi:hypothetical protein